MWSVGAIILVIEIIKELTENVINKFTVRLSGMLMFIILSNYSLLAF